MTPLEKYADFMQNLTPERVGNLSTLVAPDVCFQDPFNRVCNLPSMQRIFAHMFENLGKVKFEIRDLASNGKTGYLHWSLTGSLRGKAWTFEGMTVVQFNDAGLVVSHIDYWDAAREFYEHFPVIGWVLRKIRTFISVEK